MSELTDFNFVKTKHSMHIAFLLFFLEVCVFLFNCPAFFRLLVFYLFVCPSISSYYESQDEIFPGVSENMAIIQTSQTYKRSVFGTFSKPDRCSTTGANQTGKQSQQPAK